MSICPCVQTMYHIRQCGYLNSFNRCREVGYSHNDHSTCCKFSLDLPHWGNSNENYPQIFIHACFADFQGGHNSWLKSYCCDMMLGLQPLKYGWSLGKKINFILNVPMTSKADGVFFFVCLFLEKIRFAISYDLFVWQMIHIKCQVLQ